jgi:hypothetical protein
MTYTDLPLTLEQSKRLVSTRLFSNINTSLPAAVQQVGKLLEKSCGTVLVLICRCLSSWKVPRSLLVVLNIKERKSDLGLNPTVSFEKSAYLLAFASVRYDDPTNL